MTESLKLKNYNLNPSDSNVASSYRIVEAGCEKNGVYGYNWEIATAGDTHYSNANYTAPYSICSKGWRLPTSQEGENLFEKYGKDYSSLQSSVASFGTIHRFECSSQANEEYRFIRTSSTTKLGYSASECYDGCGCSNQFNNYNAALIGRHGNQLYSNWSCTDAASHNVEVRCIYGN